MKDQVVDHDAQLLPEGCRIAAAKNRPIDAIKGSSELLENRLDYFSRRLQRCLILPGNRQA